jgi:hypothetical protein
LAPVASETLDLHRAEGAVVARVVAGWPVTVNSTTHAWPSPSSGSAHFASPRSVTASSIRRVSCGSVSSAPEAVSGMIEYETATEWPGTFLSVRESGPACCGSAPALAGWVVA